MMKAGGYLFAILVLVWLCACKQQDKIKPIMVGSGDTLYFPFDKVEFITHSEGWEAVFYSWLQPIAIQTSPSKQGFTVSALNKKGIVEGPGQLILTNKGQFYYYPVYLKNKAEAMDKTDDYRSPKTVNPDSSLGQQQILLKADKWRNIVDASDGPDLFEEVILSLPAKTGVYYAFDSMPIFSYYVQPGSVTTISLNVEYKKEDNIYKVVAGPMRDIYDNEVANGTLVSFIYQDGSSAGRIEALLLNGFATAFLSAEGGKIYSLYARVDDTRSSIIKINPR